MNLSSNCLYLLVMLPVLFSACAGLHAPASRIDYVPAELPDVAPVATPAPAPEPEMPALPPPPTESITLLPRPRTLRFEPGAYVSDRLDTTEVVQPGAMPHAQGYLLTISDEGVRIVAHDDAGAFYAHQTLTQLARQFTDTGKLPVVYIEDWPDFPNRGVMLDISRDKVPTMETVYALVDLFAELKYNQLQLYTEHTFAYPGHEVVWQDASPMTPDQIRALDAYCIQRHIELVPNQNSFGHMHRWLRHDEYQHLSETPKGTDLCPVHPGSIELLRDMYDSLLPHFSSDQFNVGCDETFTLGRGGSKREVARIGKGRVYLNFLEQIHALVSGHGRTMQFWGDIILQHPELISELPDNIIALEWGYEANHPFAQRGRKFADSGIPFYVCPGTSSWNSLLSRTDNALENLRLAARNGLDNGAIGYLVTDWGDNGHWQTLPVSLTPFAWGAALSWAYDANAGHDLSPAVDTHVFRDKARVMTRAAMDLGSAHARTGMLRGNSTVYYGLLMHAMQGDPSRGYLSGMSRDGIANARAQIVKALEDIAQSQMERDDAHLIRSEFNINARMALFALRLGDERLRAGGVGVAQLAPELREALAVELKDIIEEYKTIWLARNRHGGLEDSVARMKQILDLLSR